VGVKISDIKQLGSYVEKLTAESRATGPKTEAGKLKSALNATRHGLAGKNLLLPGEDPVEYEVRMDEFFSTLAPKDEGEAQLVALVADDVWKLSRLAKIEKGVGLARIEELLALTGSGDKAGNIVNAIQAMGNALVAWSAEPVPTTRTPDFDRRYGTMCEAVALVNATVTGIPLHLVDACDAALDEARGKKDAVEISPSSYMKVFETCRMLMTTLLDMGQRQDAEQDQLRASISGIALPDEAELKKLARYRAMLEISLQRRLAALEQLRKLTAANVAGEKDQEKAREFRVKLRVVA
jgi:hypothetical protein